MNIVIGQQAVEILIIAAGASRGFAALRLAQAGLTVMTLEQRAKKD